MIERIKNNKIKVIILVVILLVILVSIILFLNNNTLDNVLKRNDFKLINTINVGDDYIGNSKAKYKRLDYKNSDGSYSCYITYINDNSELDKRYEESLEYQLASNFVIEQKNEKIYKYVIYEIPDVKKVGALINYNGQEILITGDEKNKVKQILDDIISTFDS